METTVLDFFPALEAGFDPKNYSYDKADIPLGSYRATLDFMLWSKSGLTINCFFTLTGSGKKISLSVFRKAANQERYFAGETEVRYLAFGCLVELTVESNELVKPVLVDLTVEK